MALNKVTYVDNVTVIGATNLNAIQDEIIANGTNIGTLTDGKVDKVTGKGLSTNDYTTEQMNKLAGIQSGATATDVAYDSTNGKLKKTVNGTTSDVVTVDAEPTENSKNPVQSGGVHGALGAVNEDVEALQTSVQNLESTANQFIENGAISEKVPYNFRKTGGSEHVGTALVEKIVGGTIAWNQLLPLNTGMNYTAYDITVSYDSNRYKIVVSASPDSDKNGFSIVSSTNNKFIAGHKYLLDYYSSNPTYVGSQFGNGTQLGTTTILSYQADGTLTYRAVIKASCPTGTYYINAMRFDLTQMFGSAIADYIYTLEQTTAGAGVALFKSMFQKDYYAYNAGELMSVQTAEKNTVGFNQWDEEWESGNIKNENGQKLTDGSRIRCVNYIPVVGGATYCFHCGGGNKLGLYAYDANKSFIGVYAAGAFIVGSSSSTDIGSDTVITLPSNCRYIKIKCISSYGTTYNHDICINLSDPAKNGTYEPYAKHTYPLDSTLTLRGVPKLDANNQIYYDGDTYEADGKVTRRYGIVDLGTLTWTFNSGTNWNCFSATLSGKKNGIRYNYKLICQRYPYGEVYGTENDKVIAENLNNSSIYIRDTSYADAATFKTAMSGVYLVYELATPTTETASSYTNPQTVDSNGTEEFVDAGVTATTPPRDVSIPVGHESQYMPDIVRKINGLPSDFSTLIATTESAMKATRAYSANDFIIVNNQLYKVTTPIASGATLTPGTNVTATTIGAVLTALLNA